jgi:hypothetical protein
MLQTDSPPDIQYGNGSIGPTLGGINALAAQGVHPIASPFGMLPTAGLAPEPPSFNVEAGTPTPWDGCRLALDQFSALRSRHRSRALRIPWPLPPTLRHGRLARWAFLFPQCQPPRSTRSCKRRAVVSSRIPLSPRKGRFIVTTDKKPKGILFDPTVLQWFGPDGRRVA